MITDMIVQLFNFVVSIFNEGVTIDNFHITFLEIFVGDIILVAICWCINKLFGADGYFRGE